MAIYLYTGTVGSGKSYHALCDGLEKVKEKDSFVVANFPIMAKTEKEKTRWNYMDTFEPEDLIKLSFENKTYGREGKAVCIIDEAGVWFNSRDWQIDGNKRKEWIKFFSQSRKFGYDIVMVAQDARMIDRQIRSLAEYDVKHIKLKNYTWMKLLPFQVFAYVYHWSGGAFKGSVKLKIFNPRKGKKYNTMKLFKMNDEILELAKKHGYALEAEGKRPDKQEEGRKGFPRLFAGLKKKKKGQTA